MRYIGRTFAIAGALALATSSSVLAQDGSTAPGSTETVVPPGGDPLGVPYDEWAGRYWKWAVGIPSSENPMLNDSCQAGQDGDVFFIPLTIAAGTTTTTCAIGADQWIYVSAGGTIWTNSDGETIDELAAAVDADRATFTDPAVIIDGVPVSDVEAYWAVSPPFTVTYVEDNVFGMEAGLEDDAVAGSFGVMIPPLSPGHHTVVVRDGPANSEGAVPSTSDVTAEITVAATE